MVGNRLKENEIYARMLDKKEGRRCWTIHYADGAQFHMDILPAIPDDTNFPRLIVVPEMLAQHAVCITDQTSVNYDLLYDTDWPRSNPRGYAEWFKERMKVQFEIQKKFFAERMRADIEDVPEYRIKTTLQRSIQLLKRHRDIIFANDPDDKPVSIIITTLAALAYNNQADLKEALFSIVDGMPKHIQKVNGISWVPNPVNPQENFADKWLESPQKELKFRNWLLKVTSDLDSVFKEGDASKLAETLKYSFGAVAVQKALSAAGSGGLGVNSTTRKSPPQVIIRNPNKPWGKK